MPNDVLDRSFMFLLMPWWCFKGNTVSYDASVPATASPINYPKHVFLLHYLIAGVCIIPRIVVV